MREFERMAEDVEILESYRTKEQLEIELADAALLQRLSIELIQEDGIAGLYKKIVEAAVAIMRSQFGTIQMLYPDRVDPVGRLRLLASHGFTEDAQKYWEWVYSHSFSSCGEVLRTGKRVIIPDYASCEFMKNAPTLQIFLDGNVYAAQSTPLYSRTGKLLGMISTHWDHVHNPPERHLRLFDILARQAADLIERVNSAEALRQSEERMRALSIATNDIIYKMSPDWNEMYHLDGRNSLQNTGETITNWLEKYILPEDMDRVRNAINKALESNHEFHLEHRVFKADGSVGWVSSRAIPVRDHEGNLVEWYGAASDITEKKAFLEELENRVGLRTLELKRSNEDLQQFAHVASHDLKEPVRKIRTYGLLLQKELEALGEGREKSFLGKILESASRMSTMVDGVLTYSTMNATGKEVELMDLHDVMSDICNDLEILIQEKNASINCYELPKIEGSRVLIYQLFYNLINNSLKFSSLSGKPEIKITSSITGSGDAEYASIVVADNGIGFGAEQNENIFKAFTRLNPKTTYDGTGLGLSLARKIVERHHGSIEAQGQMDTGAIFTVNLPLKQNEPIT
ncbi:ATP-binding protein [Chryseolinea sp. T2]|uniref:ATP-binding protein n=1 Tax=Chryseolinea sp. T2 TaxID=3129255 RepID=UPI0030780C7C